MSDTDSMKSWGIKSIPARVVDEITETARTSTPKLSVGQLIERAWEHWQSGAQVVTLPPGMTMPPPPPMAEVIGVLEAVHKISHLGETVQAGVRTEANRLAKVALLDLKRRYLAHVGVAAALDQAIATTEQRQLTRVAALAA